jgi:hypothetical protein
LDILKVVTAVVVAAAVVGHLAVGTVLAVAIYLGTPQVT